MTPSALTASVCQFPRVILNSSSLPAGNLKALVQLLSSSLSNSTAPVFHAPSFSWLPTMNTFEPAGRVFGKTLNVMSTSSATPLTAHAGAKTPTLNFPTKLFLQFRIADLNHRRPTMRTGVRQIAPVQLCQQRPQLLALKRIVRLHRVPAHGRRDLVLAEPARVQLLAA